MWIVLGRELSGRVHCNAGGTRCTVGGESAGEWDIFAFECGGVWVLDGVDG
jgi:hypothetical protein